MINRNRVRLSKLSLGLAIALAAAPAFAQSTSSAVGGRITDASGQPVSGAQVTIVHTDSGTTSQVTTGSDGRYVSRGLRVGGPYTITISKDGRTEKREGVYLQLAESNNVDAVMGAAANIATVEVTGTGAISVFSATKMGSGTNVDQETLKALPSVNGNIQDFMRLDPRVAFTDRASGSISAGGMNPRFNKITIDGVSASDTFGLEGNNMPTQRQPVSLQAIEAIDINLSNYDVTMSGAAGAQVNAVTKSGTNQFHGSVYGMYRDGDWFGDYPARAAGSTIDVTGLPFDEFEKDTTWGFTFGGPLVKDTLFFFVNYEKLKTTEIGTAGGKGLGTNPLVAGGDFDADDVQQAIDIAKNVWGIDAGGLVGGDTELEEYALKLDWNINDNHRASLRYSKLEQTRVRPEASTASALSLSSNWYNHEKTVESYVAQLFSDWSENFSTEFKVSFRDYDAIRVNPTTAPTIQIYFDDGNNSNAPSAGDFIRMGTERSSMGNTLLTETWNYFGSGTWHLGDHDLKFGAEYSDNDIYNYFLQDSWGNYSFYGLTNFQNGIYFDYDLQYQTSADSVPAIYSNRNLGLFLQDTWYVNSNLTLTFGLRGDKPSTSPQPPYNATFAAPQTINPNTGAWTGGFGYDNSVTFNGDFLIQPRFGFNYTFDTQRQMQLRGGIGLFQGDAPQVWVSNSYQSNGLNYIAYSNYRHCLWNNSAPGQSEGSRNATCLNSIFNPDGLNPTVPPSATANRNVNVMDPDFEMPSVWKANLAFDTETGWMDTVFSAEILLTDINKGLFYRSLNVGPGFDGPDGRRLYWNPNSPRPFGNTASGNTATNPARYNNNSTFGDVYLITNTDKGSSRQFTLSLARPFAADRDWSWSIAYTYTNASEVASLTSSTAGSGYGSQLSFNIDDDLANTARYEIKDRFTASLDWKHAFFGDYETRVGLVYEGRSGRPFSYIFNNDANGDNRTFNDLFYVPSGPGDVLFGSLNATTGAFTANPTMEAAFWAWLDTQEHLNAYAGSYAPENDFRAGWVNTFDLRISQELPGFMKGHKSQIWVDIQNIGNMIDKDWGNIIDYGFNANVAVASLVGICRVNCPAGMTGKYVYGYRSGTEFGQATALGLPTNADGQTNGISQWSVQVGFKYEF
ncbi:TonB-dependent receptor [Arenimonas sp.]|uniref:TonB-dependent receptor n=1 Tax=Arenimonas sp. TaxID=1872635 RepID=UPI0039E3F006